MNTNSVVQRSLRYPLWILTLLLFVGCSISLISKYDQVIDQGITDAQKKMDLLLIQKQRVPAQPYDNGAYESLFADLQSLQTRAASVPKNSQTSTILSLIIAQVQIIKTTDSSGKGSPAFFATAQTTIDQNCQNALTLELAKKRGE